MGPVKSCSGYLADIVLPVDMGVIPLEEAASRGDWRRILVRVASGVVCVDVKFSIN